MDTINNAYGVVNTTDTIDSLMDQLHDIKKHNNERIREFIARIDKIILQLNTLNSPINTRMRKHYILRGLRHLTQWNIHVTMIQKMDRDGKWTGDELEQYLVGEENKQLMEGESKAKVASETALATDTRHNTYTRGGYRGRVVDRFVGLLVIVVVVDISIRVHTPAYNRGADIENRGWTTIKINVVVPVVDTIIILVIVDAVDSAEEEVEDITIKTAQQ